MVLRSLVFNLFLPNHSPHLGKLSRSLGFEVDGYSEVTKDSQIKYLKPEDELLEGFFHLTNLNLSGLKYKEFIKIYFDHLPLIPDISIPCYSKKPETLFRAMRCKNEPNTINRLSYPPPEITKAGRLNIEGHPVLYTSDKPLISFLEIDAQPKEYIYVGIWKAKDFYKRYINPFLINYKGTNTVLLKQKSMLNNCLKEMDSEIARRYATLYKLVTEMLLGSNIGLSSFLGHTIFNEHKGHMTDIIIYPSIKANRRHVNFAFSKRMVDDNFSFIGASLFEVVEINENEQYGKFLCHKQGIPYGNEILWKEEQTPSEALLTLGP